MWGGQLSRELSISSKLSTGLDFRKFDTCLYPHPTSKWKFIIADAHRLPFQDETFDLILGVGLLEHVRDYRIVIEEMMRTLKPGGYLFFTGWPNGNIWKYFDKPDHIVQVYHHPTPRELCSCLSNGKFKRVWAYNVYYRLAKQPDFVLGRNLPKPLQLIINLKFFRYVTIGIAYCLEQLNLEEIVQIVYQKASESGDDVNDS
jgi:SAM-dependent methyltransferase